jgi:hypothetical protein
MHLYIKQYGLAHYPVRKGLVEDGGAVTTLDLFRYFLQGAANPEAFALSFAPLLEKITGPSPPLATFCAFGRELERNFR